MIRDIPPVAVEIILEVVSVFEEVVDVEVVEAVAVVVDKNLILNLF